MLISVQCVDHPASAAERFRDVIRRIGPRENHDPYGGGESSLGSFVSDHTVNTTAESTGSSTNPETSKGPETLRRVELWKETGDEGDGKLRQRRLVIFYKKSFITIHCMFPSMLLLRLQL